MDKYKINYYLRILNRFGYKKLLEVIPFGETFTNFLTQSMRKYKIDELLDKLPHKKYSEAINSIPEMLGVAPNTFHNYRKFNIEDSKDIPHRRVCQLELWFGIEQGGLKNYEVTLNPPTVKKKPRNK